MRRTYLLLMNCLFSRMTLLLLIAGCNEVKGQRSPDAIPFHELFSIERIGKGEEAYLHFGPDSLKGDPVRGPVCSALRNFHDYLYTHYAAVYDRHTELQKLLPDTGAMKQRYDGSLDADTAFQQVYMLALRKEKVDPLPLDSAMRIAAHFFYVHRMEGKVTMHVCIGINKVQEMSTSPSHPYHAAFCYMAIWGMKHIMKLFQQVVDPYRAEMRAGPTDERLNEVEQVVYDKLARDPRLRKAVLKEYDRKAKYLPFELIK